MRRIALLASMLFIALLSQYFATRGLPKISVTKEIIAGNPAERYSPSLPAQGTVVVAHGFAGNKTLMRHWGFALAQYGFETIIFDQPGHGENNRSLPAWRSSSSENPLGKNLESLIDELVRTGKAKPGRIAVVGHSMGTSAAVAAAISDTRISATVAVSTLVGPDLPPNRPANLLLIAADRDTPGVLQAVKSSGRSVVRIHGRNHITVIFDLTAIETSAEWIHKSMGTQAPSSPPERLPWHWVWVALATGLGAVVGAGRLLAPSRQSSVGIPGRTSPLTGLVTLAVASLSAVLASVYLRVPGLRVAVVDYLLAYFLVMAAVLWVLRMVWPREFAFAISPEQEPALVSGLRGAGLFLGFAGAVVPVVHMNLSHFIPEGFRVVTLVILSVGLGLYFVQEEALKRATGEWLGFAVGVAAKMLILATWLGATALPNPPGFLVLVTPVALVLMLVTETFSLIFRRMGFSPTTVAVFSALVMGWASASVFPVL